MRSVEHLGSEAHVFFSVDTPASTLVSDLELGDLDVPTDGAHAAAPAVWLDCLPMCGQHLRSGQIGHRPCQVAPLRCRQW